MKAIIISAVVLLAVGAHGWSLYGEKEEALEAVKGKYDEVFKLIAKVQKDIDSEKTKEDKEAMEAAKSAGNEKRNVTEIQFKKDIIDTARSAIARGKPLAAIECIVRVQDEGEKLIKSTQEDYVKAVDEIKPNKVKLLEWANSELNLIKLASEGLKEESLKKINETSTGFPALKADGLKKANAADKHVHEIERRVPKPVLKEQYTLAGQYIEEKFKEVRENLYKRLQKCIA